MGVFIRTLIVCLIICVGYYFYMFLGKESYESLDTNKTTVSQDSNNYNRAPEPKKNDNEQLKPQMQKMKICFMSNDSAVHFVEREAENATLEGAINELLKGPTKYETAHGVYSEIPADVKLMWVKDENGKIIVNLTKNFEYGGGTSSIQNRIKQIKLTVDSFNQKKPVYLYLDGKQVEYMGGEGIYIEQPLN